MSKKEIPVIFRGDRRFYRVIGVQDDVFYGLNLEISQHSHGVMNLILALACIGDPPKTTPFKKRAHGAFLMAYEEKPDPNTKPIVVKGWRLDKIERKLGKNLSAFEGTQHIMDQVPAMKAWLDETMENAGIVPLYNDVGEIFQYFFGKDNMPEAERFPLELPVVGKSVEGVTDVAFTMDYSKYKGGAIDPASGEILPKDPMLGDVGDASTDTHHMPHGWKAQSEGGPIDGADADAQDPEDM